MKNCYELPHKEQRLMWIGEVPQMSLWMKIVGIHMAGVAKIHVGCWGVVMDYLPVRKAREKCH